MKTFKDLKVGDNVFIITHDKLDCKYILSVRTITNIIDVPDTCIELSYDMALSNGMCGQFVLGNTVYKSHVQTDVNHWLFTDEQEAFEYRHELRHRKIEQIKKDIKDLKHKQKLYEEIF